MALAAAKHDEHDEPLGSAPLAVRPVSDDSVGMMSQGGTGGQDLDNALTALRARVEEEFRVSERLDAKARQAFALAAGFFAVVQTVAFGGYRGGGISTGERIWLLVLVIAAGIALVKVAHDLRGGEELLVEADLRPEAVIDWWDEAPDDEPDYVSLHLLRELGRVARARADNNVIRQRRYEVVAAATRLSLIAAGAELLSAVLVRL